MKKIIARHVAPRAMTRHAIACGSLIATSLAGLLVAVGIGGGCIGSPSNPAATQPVTESADPATTQPFYWYDQPGQTVSYDDFEKLWSACEDVARDFLFKLDRMDYRSGILTTVPLTSSQWFEFWRPDVRTFEDVQESSTAAVRRTIRFQFVRRSDGNFDVSPKVLIERESIGEQRITSVVGYRAAFTRPIKVHDRERGSRESDVGIDLPWRYWYATGRDETLEGALVRDLQEKLKHADAKSE